MTKSKKLNIFLFSLVLVLSSLLFVACGKPDYSQVYISTSSEYVEVFVGQEKTLTITIENPVANMSKLVKVHVESDKFSIIDTSPMDYSITYTIRGDEGGNGSISFVTDDGAIEKTVDVVVRKYSETFASTSQKMVVTEQSIMIPSDNDFSFDDYVSEKELDFYFYGLYDESAENVAAGVKDDGGAYIKSFVSVKVEKIGEYDYLIFEDKFENLYTVAKSILYTENKLYFVNVDYSQEDGYTLAGIVGNYEYYTISAGEKFSFVAKYNTIDAAGENVELTAIKHFVYYKSISSAATEITYKENTQEAIFNKVAGALENTITIEGIDRDIVTLIPSYTPTIDGVGTVDFLTAYVVIKINNYNELIKFKAYSANDNVVTSKFLGQSVSGDIVCYQLTCAQGNKANTSFVVEFYYDEFENSNNGLVNYKCEIPVEIRNIPKALLINNISYTQDDKKVDNKTIFYNSYIGTAGWRAFDFDVNPTEAEFTSFAFDLTGTGLSVKYKNSIYNEADCADGLLYINDMSQTIYIRGQNGTEVKNEAFLPIYVGIDILKEETLQFFFCYSIEPGVSKATYEDSYFKTNGIFVDLNASDVSLEFKEEIFVDALYQSATISHLTGENVVAIFLQNRTAKSATEYYINLKFKPIKASNQISSYLITLDNGYSFEIKVKVVEALQSIAVETTNENNLIKFQSNAPNTYYLYSKDGDDWTTKTLDFFVYANNNQNSQAITEVDIEITDSSTFAIQDQTADGKNFNIQLFKNGALENGIIVKAKGSAVIGFKSIEISLEKQLSLYAYSYIDGFTTKQVIVEEGVEKKLNASYVSVYTNINNEDLRTIVLDFDTSGDGYIFYDYSEEAYISSEFDKKFIYWEILSSKAGATTQLLSHKDDSLTIAEGTFIIDNENGRLSFIAGSEGLNGGEEIYLLTHIQQFGKVFTYTTRIQVQKYVPVDQISLQEAVESLSLSVLNQNASVIAIPIITTAGESATNPTIGCSVETDVELLKGVFTQDDKWGNKLDVVYDEGTNKTLISLSITDAFIAEIAGKTESLTATLKIFANDWLSGTIIAPAYKAEVLSLQINFENGTEANRLSIITTQHLEYVANNLSAHYQLLSIIDASSMVESEKFPLGTLGGSIVGIKDYAKITGLDYTNSEKTGVFTSIATSGYIKNISFEGSFNWESDASSAVGLIAGINEGTIENISVTINASDIAMGSERYFGGIVGENKGLISQDFSVYGSSNPIYRDSTPKTLVYFDSTMKIKTGEKVKIGGVAGVNGGTIQKIDNDSLTCYGYTNYTAFTNISTTGNQSGTTLGGIAGVNTNLIDGILVGGHIAGYGMVAGVAGTSTGELSSLTTRTFVRSHTGQIAIVAATSSDVSNITIEAVDNGAYGREASMAIVYTSEDSYTAEKERYFGDGTGITSLVSITIKTYVNRDVTGIIEEGVNDNIASSAYLGDFIVVKHEAGADTDILLSSYTFGLAAEKLEVLAGFDNEMTGAEELTNKVFYTYFYGIESFAIDAGAANDQMEKEFETVFNRLTASADIYPFEFNIKDVIFTSKNTDVLTIDQNGIIQIKGAGLAYIKAQSILNLNEGLDFYIYVTNYINRDSTISIVYPNASPSATALDETEIVLRANNVATLYIRPDYSYETADVEISALGRGRYKNVIFNLAKNDEVTAVVTLDEAISVSQDGQSISLRRNNAEDDKYELEIQPILTCQVEDVRFTANVNKHIENSKIDYKKGALRISNKRYIDTSICTSVDLVDTLMVQSTASDEGNPLYQIIDEDGKVVQTNIGGTHGNLFNVDITVSKSEDKTTYYNHYFDLSIKVNQGSEEFANRYNNNIYKKYTFVAFAQTNMTKTVSFTFSFDQTEIIAVPIDNYSKLADTLSGTLPSKSEKAYPGESGVLAISVTPVDAGFDSVVIRNADDNYLPGRTNAVFTLIAKKTTEYNAHLSQNSLFENTTIVGSQGKNGLEIRLQDIIDVYSETYDVNKNKYEKYNGVIYVRYDFNSQNVDDNSVSRIYADFMKDGQKEPIAYGFKDLTIKLQYYVGVEIVGKAKDADENGYYSSYTVASGLKYELKVNSYGFAKNDITLICANDAIAEIIKENDKYYLQIKSPTLTPSNNKFDIFVVGDNGEKSESSKTRIKVQDFVLNYNSEIENDLLPDIVEGMESGVINVQIGTQTTLSIDLYDYIEYDANNNEVVNKIKNFLLELAKTAKWTAYTNIDENSLKPDYNLTAEEGKTFEVKGNVSIENYYFKTNGLNIINLRKHSVVEDYYFFTLEVHYKQSGTGYVASASGREISTKFKYNVYTSSSEEHPIPIEKYEDFKSMYAGSHYILLKDIVLPKDYKPFLANFASFDGNGNTIHWQGEYDFGNLDNMGIFTEIETNTVVKNLNINFIQTKLGSTTTPVTITSQADSFEFGALCSLNNGIITNCQVFSSIKSANRLSPAGSGLDNQSDIIVSGAANANNILAGLVATNNGYITNCSVKLDITSTASIAGVVSTNNGKIAATSFKGGTLLGEGANQNTAGFVGLNSENGQIITSYVSGNAQSNVIYSTGATLNSSQPSAGFVFINNGIIQDCYSDIAMNSVSARNAGFVYSNTGTVKNSFSLSIIKSNNTSSAGFAMENAVSATLTNCYYYYDPGQNVNTALAQVDKTYGITRLNNEGFKDLTNFVEYSFVASPDTKSIWFYCVGESSDQFFERSISFEYDANNDIVTSYQEKQNKAFAKGRLELVSANIIAYSKRDFFSVEKDPQSGDEVYYYIDSFDASNRGSVYNPIIISTAQQMENLFLEQASSALVNTSNYRIISDIDYNSEETGIEGYSNLFKLTFAGIIEGNGMELDQIGLVSMDKLSDAGLFGQIGKSASQIGSVKNLTIAPREVAFSSANSVGTLAGTISYGYIYDINVVVAQDTNMTVTGLNFVGGIVGKAINAFEIKNVSSNLNASAGQNPKEDLSFTDNNINYSKYSYAGSIAGYIGSGSVYNAYVSGVSSVMGGRAGFAYGGLGLNANVNYTYVTMLTGSIVRAYKYGGFVAGEVCGTLNYSSVEGTGIEESFFASIPDVALAVGGIAGRLNSGHIKNAVMKQPFKLVQDNSGKTVSYIGGIVGLVQGNGIVVSHVSDCIVDANITTCTNLGGAVGQVYTGLIMDSVAVKSQELTVAGQTADPKLGGLVGNIDMLTSNVSISNCYSTSKLHINTYTSGIMSIAKVSGFVANAENANFSMRSCYTTSKIEASVYDIRKVDNVVNFSQKDNDLGDVNNCLRKVSFQQIIRRNANIQDVYYLGSASEGLNKDSYTTSTQNFVDFTSKSKSVEIGLIVNQYGISSMQYMSAGAVDKNNLDKPFYGLFGSDYDYVDEETDKHFILRYNSTTGYYEAYDAIRKYIVDGGFTGRWGFGPDAYEKKTLCSTLTFKEFEQNGDDYDIKGTEYKRIVYYYMDKENGVTDHLECKEDNLYPYKKYLKTEDDKIYVWDGTGFALWESNNFISPKAYIDLTKIYKHEAIKGLIEASIYTYDLNPNNKNQLVYKQQVDTDPAELGDDDYCTQTVDMTKWVAMSLYKDDEDNIYKAQKDDAGNIEYKNIYKNNVFECIYKFQESDISFRDGLHQLDLSKLINSSGKAIIELEECKSGGKLDAGKLTDYLSGASGLKYDVFDCEYKSGDKTIAIKNFKTRLIPIWNPDLTRNRLTTLLIEDNLGWLNKK